MGVRGTRTPSSSGSGVFADTKGASIQRSALRVKESSSRLEPRCNMIDDELVKAYEGSRHTTGAKGRYGASATSCYVANNVMPDVVNVMPLVLCHLWCRHRMF